MKKCDLLVFGETTLDTICQVDRLASPESAAGRISTIDEARVGGRCVNVGTYAAVFKNDIELLTACGQDYIDEYLKLSVSHLNHSDIFISKDLNATARALIFRDQAKATTYFYPGVIKLKHPDIESYKRHIRKRIASLNPKVVYCASELHGMVEEVLQNYHTNKRVLKVFAPGPEIQLMTSEGLQRILKYTDFLFVNSAEMMMLQSHLRMAFQQVVVNFDLKGAIATLGQGGAILITRTTSRKTTTNWLPSYPMGPDDIVDSTGAGDSLAGAFLGHYVSSGIWDPQESLQYGIATSSLVLEVSGALIPNLTLSMIENRYQQYRKVMEET